MVPERLATTLDGRLIQQLDSYAAFPVLSRNVHILQVDCREELLT